MSVILTDVAPRSSDERLLKGLRGLDLFGRATPTVALAIRKTATVNCVVDNCTANQNVTDHCAADNRADTPPEAI
jgi:hypothetical protein